MLNRLKLIVLPLAASAFFFHSASHSIQAMDVNQDPAQVVDQATADQANVDLSNGATDKWWPYYGYGYGLYNSLYTGVCNWWNGCYSGYSWPYYGYGWGGLGGWGGYWGGYGGRFGRFGGHHHHGRHR